MREDSPRWEQINPSAYLHEQDGLRELSSYLPDAEPYHVWANVLGLKHWPGRLSGDGHRWQRRRPPNGRRSTVDSPLTLANRKAKRLRSVIAYYAPAEHVPYLPAHRYKPSGLRKRAQWERVWAQQRLENAGEDVDIKVPPKCTSADFAKPSYWRVRGKLDVPKERFISYPKAGYLDRKLQAAWTPGRLTRSVLRRPNRHRTVPTQRRPDSLDRAARHTWRDSSFLEWPL
ncbi:DUF7008 domain-containing protein [Micromonospora radicis]|uniref:DUF7008 domain-containing protein n=1 Tax=Micromonospora radicis TaxID=1894971 RepID=UPI001F2A8B77|nr:hypothetical protein [Micromonospora radicis]